MLIDVMLKAKVLILICSSTTATLLMLIKLGNIWWNTMNMETTPRDHPRYSKIFFDTVMIMIYSIGILT